jgi:hypothetical protein
LVLFCERRYKQDEKVSVFFFAITFGLIFISPFMQTLRTLKCAFWPFQSDQSSSLFLNAVAANQRGPGTLGDNQARSYGNTRYFI